MGVRGGSLPQQQQTPEGIDSDDCSNGSSSSSSSSSSRLLLASTYMCTFFMPQTIQSQSAAEKQEFHSAVDGGSQDTDHHQPHLIMAVTKS